MGRGIRGDGGGNNLLAVKQTKGMEEII